MDFISKYLNQKAPYLDSSYNKILLVGFLSIFTLIFLSVYNPFNMKLWGGSIPGYVFIGASTMLFSQFGHTIFIKKTASKTV